MNQRTVGYPSTSWASCYTMTQPYNHIIYPGVAKIFLVFFLKVSVVSADIIIFGKLFLGAGLVDFQVSIKEVKRMHSPHSKNQYYAVIANDGQSVTRISDPAELATSCRIPQLQSTD